MLSEDCASKSYGYHPDSKKCNRLVWCRQVTLEDLQLGRSLLHRQAEAAIKEADGQIKLNKEQYDQAGRLLVHVKASKFLIAHLFQTVSSLRHALLCWVVPGCKMHIAVHNDTDCQMVRQRGQSVSHVSLSQYGLGLWNHLTKLLCRLLW